jgi:hypothetical protein
VENKTDEHCLMPINADMHQVAVVTEAQANLQAAQWTEFLGCKMFPQFSRSTIIRNLRHVWKHVVQN